MPLPTAEQFKVRQDPSGTRIKWAYVVVLALVVFGVLGYCLESDAPLLIFVPVALVFVFLVGRKEQARLLLRTDPYKLAIEVVKAGHGIPLSRTELSWKELEHFQYIPYEESSDLLVLKWQNGTTNYFSGGDIGAFYQYLRTYFSEKEESPKST